LKRDIARPKLPARFHAAGVMVAGFGLAATQALSLPLDFTVPVREVARQSEALASYAMPVGPYANGVVPVRAVEGFFEQEGYELDTAGLTTLELLAPLRAQLAAGGYRTVFECESFGCGGFDFRFGTRVMPEPDMHVDLGDFRYLAAVKGEEVLSLIVSRSSFAGFVQVTRVSPVAEQPLELSLSSKSTEAPALVEVAPTHPLDRILGGEAVVLQGLAFASSEALLEPGSETALVGLADWLNANPAATVQLVGYTDSSGPLDANIALSRARAEAVVNALVADFGIAASRLQADGLGPENPIADNATPEGRRTNRRVEVSLTSTPVAP
jgi:outer membrane protein OmpA-like peptidoglycan-associated protein